LLVEDGLRDGSSEIARAYAAREPHRIRVREHAEHANLGMSALLYRASSLARRLRGPSSAGGKD
jgi:glycosyltransferase involved in cell wall biosynthesis